MTSEIRANTIKNRVGLGTIEYSNTGPVISGVTTALNFKTGTSNLHSTGLNIFDLDVDGHTNLDNVSIAGITTTTETIRIGADNKYLKIGAGDDLSFVHTGGQSFITNSTGHLTGRSASYTWENLAGSTEYLRINTNGRVGISTDNPQTTLYSMNEIAAGDGNRRFIGMQTKIVDGTAVGEIRTTYYSGANGSYPHIRFVTSDTERLRITTNGYIGVGVANPNHLLHLHRGDSGNSYTQYTNTTTGSASSDGVWLGMGSDENCYLWHNENKEMYLGTNNTTRLHITSSGYVTTKSELWVGGSAPVLRWRDSTHGEKATARIDGSDLYFEVANNERLRIKSNGHVMIGTTTEGFATYGDQFTIANSGHCGMTIRSGSSSDGNIYFSDGTSGADEVRGFVEYNHSSNYMQLGTNGSARVQINSSGQFSIFDGTGAYYKPALHLKNTYHGGWGGAVIFTGENGSGTEYTQARIRTYGGSGAGDGSLAIEAGDLNEVARFKSGFMTMGGFNANISAARGIEIGNAATTEIRLKNTNSGTGQADGFAIQKWSNDITYLYEYDNSDIVFGVANQSKLKLFKQGRLTLSPSGNTNGGNSGYALSIVQDGNYTTLGAATGTYPGIHIRSTSTGGGNGVGLFTPDQNWGLYTNAGNKTGFAIAPNTSAASSANTKLFVREDGHTSLGSRTYEELSDSIKCKVMLSVTGGGLALSGYNLQNSAGEDPRHIKNWYSVAESTGATYHHLVTSLWGGGSPHGNTSHIMGGFTIKGYSYGGTYSGISNNTGLSNEDIFFHNWNGTTNHGYKRHYYGSGFDPGNAAYVNSSGYVTLRLKAGRYVCYYIDLYQFQVYAVRDIYVTSHTLNGNTTI